MRFDEITLPEPATVPPIVAPAGPPSTKIPSFMLPSGMVPMRSVPMKFPSIGTPVTTPCTEMPFCVLSEMTLAAPATVPPIVAEALPPRM